MASWKHEQVKPVLEKFVAIQCFDCAEKVERKSELPKRHRGHEVHYVNEKGEICD